jgi:hypothetical protein
MCLGTRPVHTPHCCRPGQERQKISAPATIDEIDDDNNVVMSDPANGDVPQDPLQLDL